MEMSKHSVELWSLAWQTSRLQLMTVTNVSVSVVCRNVVYPADSVAFTRNQTETTLPNDEFSYHRLLVEVHFKPREASK